jgi:hypothetical protein
VGNAVTTSLPDHLATSGFEVGLGAFDPGEDVVGVLDQEECGVGQPDTTAVLLDQAGVGLAFELRDLLRHRRGGDVERGRGRAHRTVGRDRAQSSQAVEVEHEAMLKQISPRIVACP